MQLPLFVVSSGAAYLQTAKSDQSNERYKSDGVIWHADHKYWTTRPGKDQRRAYDGGWFINGDAIFMEAMKQWLLISHRSELERAVSRLIQAERRRI